ncbi:MAG: hypothetical protein U1F43_05630 [Myxococcota bacterium]
MWTTTDSDRESVWLHGEEVVATRPEAVTVVDGKLWALGEDWRVIKAYPCGGEDNMEGDHTKPPTSTAAPTLVAKQLGADAVVKIVDGFPDADTELDGEVWGASADLIGSVGAKVFAAQGDGLYGCGAAHGVSEASARVFDLAKQEAAPIEADDALKGKAAAALKAEGKKNDCLGDGEDEIEPVAPDALSLGFAEGRVRASWLVLREADAEWNHVCDLTAELDAPFDATLGFGAVDERVAKVVATKKGQGSLGFATVPAGARDALLEVFRKAAPSFQPKPVVAEAPAAAAGDSAGALVTQGRKLTRAKDLAGAIAAFDQAIAKDATLAAAWSGRGYAKQLAKDAGAKADFEKALTLETKDQAFQAAVWFNLGQLAEASKDLAAAKEAYAKADALKPSEAAKKALARVSK